MAHLLIVDDDLFFLKMVRKILEFSGYTVSVANDPVAGMERLQKEKIDLILTDANMPGGSGFDFVKKIRDNADTFEIPIAMLTSRRNKEDVLKGLECGATDYIVKPIDPDLFLDKIKSLMTPVAKEAEPEMELLEIPVHAAARWEIKFEIIGISEKGLVLTAPIAVAPNSYFMLSSYLFGKIQIDRPHLKVTECSPLPDKQNTFFIKASFVGLNPNEQQRIRFWLGKSALEEKKKIAA
jgi:two-component system phosphate regulon response regulator PhoB